MAAKLKKKNAPAAVLWQAKLKKKTARVQRPELEKKTDSDSLNQLLHGQAQN